jgi:tripartite-type tricarboxylate transporter receptor subunit TctC
MRKVLAMPDVRSRIQNIGYEPLAGSTPQEVTQLRKRLVEYWAPIVQTVGFKGD